MKIIDIPKDKLSERFFRRKSWTNDKSIARFKYDKWQYKGGSIGDYMDLSRENIKSDNWYECDTNGNLIPKKSSILESPEPPHGTNAWTAYWKKVCKEKNEIWMVHITLAKSKKGYEPYRIKNNFNGLSVPKDYMFFPSQKKAQDYADSQKETKNTFQNIKDFEEYYTENTAEARALVETNNWFWYNKSSPTHSGNFIEIFKNDKGVKALIMIYKEENPKYSKKHMTIKNGRFVKDEIISEFKPLVEDCDDILQYEKQIKEPNMAQAENKAAKITKIVDAIEEALCIDKVQKEQTDLEKRYPVHGTIYDTKGREMITRGFKSTKAASKHMQLPENLGMTMVIKKEIKAITTYIPIVTIK